MTFLPAPTPFNVAAHVLRHAADLAGKVALSIVAPDGSQDWTYAQLESAVRGCSTGLLNLGLAAGDRVILRLGNTADFPITYLACIAVDLIPVPLSAQLTAPEDAKSSDNIQPAIRSETGDMPVAYGSTFPADELHTLYTNLPAS